MKFVLFQADFHETLQGFRIFWEICVRVSKKLHWLIGKLNAGLFKGTSACERKTEMTFGGFMS